MNRLYTIRMGPQEIRGLISPGELPNLKSDFDWLADYYGAEKEFHDDTLIARKNDTEISLTVGDYHASMPCKRVLEVLVRMMDESFKS